VTQVTRSELWQALGYAQGVVPKIDKIVEQAYKDVEEKNYSAGDAKFRTSFHASRFPGGETEKWCGRKAMYELMNIPGEKFSPFSVAIMEQGQATERQIIWRLGQSGRLISGSVSLDNHQDGNQTRLEDGRYWLSGSLDAALDLRVDIGWKHVVPMDVKSTSIRNLIKLKIGEKEIPRNYIGQVQSYGHMARLHHEVLGWADMGLAPANGGIIYFASRDNPRETYEHWVPWDESYVEVGLRRLTAWINFFHEGRLPERPKEWRWTEEPCKWCPFKKLCKEDIRQDVVKFSASKTIDFAKTVDPGYDLNKVIEAVKGRWK
jgi:hypothetical protein